jgi:predicted DNA-binding transcriptional regulator YafY
MSQAERIYWIDDQIRRKRYPNAVSVMEHFGVSRRTAYSDRDYLLTRLNAPLIFNKERNGWVYSDTEYILPFLAFSEKEAASLRRSLLAVQEYLPDEDSYPLQLVAERLAPVASDGEIVLGAVHLSAQASIPQTLTADCRRATRDRHRLRLVYYGAHRDQITERTVRPYYLLNWRGEQHLIAWCELRSDFRQFFLGRIRDWQVLEPEAAFVRDPSFDIGQYVERGFALRHGEESVTIRVYFSPYQARWIRERRYHPSQTLEECNDGGVILTLQCAGEDEIRRWVLSFGAEAEVLEPASLRIAVAAALDKARKKYHP